MHYRVVQWKCYVLRMRIKFAVITWLIKSRGWKNKCSCKPCLRAWISLEGAAWICKAFRVFPQASPMTTVSFWYLLNEAKLCTELVLVCPKVERLFHRYSCPSESQQLCDELAPLLGNGSPSPVKCTKRLYNIFISTFDDVSWFIVYKSYLNK